MPIILLSVTPKTKSTIKYTTTKKKLCKKKTFEGEVAEIWSVGSWACGCLMLNFFF